MSKCSALSIACGPGVTLNPISKFVKISNNGAGFDGTSYGTVGWEV